MIKNFTEQDVEELANCGWMEASHEGIGGVYLVMHAVCNRVGTPGFPKTLHEVIYQHNAFSWTDPSNPEHNRKPLPGDAVYAAALTDAREVLAGDADPTKGARFYANLATMDKDGWFERNIVNKPDLHPQTLHEGNHTFFL